MRTSASLESQACPRRSVLSRRCGQCHGTKASSSGSEGLSAMPRGFLTDPARISGDRRRRGTFSCGWCRGRQAEPASFRSHDEQRAQAHGLAVLAAALRTGVDLLNAQLVGMLMGGVLWGVLGDPRGRRSVLFGSIHSSARWPCASSTKPSARIWTLSSNGRPPRGLRHPGLFGLFPQGVLFFRGG